MNKAESLDPEAPAGEDPGPAATEPAHHLRGAARRAEAHLARLCPPAPGPADTWIPARAAALDPATRARLAPRLHAALAVPVRHLVDAGRRRWRPGLVAAAIDLLGGDSEHYGPLCAAIELAHTGSLMVDDVQDGSPLRRGSPAAHLVFGTATALNAGTHAYFAFDRAVRLTAAHDPALAGRLRDVFLAALRSAHAGQGLDITGHRAEMAEAVATGDARHVLALVRLTHRLKTGAMAALGCETAALVTAADGPRRRALAAFGEALGTAYQFTDDVADPRGVRHEDGATKQEGEDTRDNKVTLPLAHAVALLPGPRMRALWDTLCAPEAGERERAEVRATLLECGAAERCVREAGELLSAAWDALAPVLPDSPRTRVLRDLAWHTVLGRSGA
ncbi:polyprenyl synthetase family protein [Streptomyces sp. SPB074]|uniref:polyprenyl synthetase family protein n=1 Tax=Streptomyces sp. (strain SPB074) TaxID=465543 RepID=UPI00017F1759|nr:polyprenyl synthetase family protein [Streptomyces sp. SPB074]EDY43337.1 polyprenyl synthetase [Streptomyces sp. SPB074]